MERDYEYEDWSDMIAASHDADIAGEEREKDFNETAKLLAGGVYDEPIAARMVTA